MVHMYIIPRGFLGSGTKCRMCEGGVGGGVSENEQCGPRARVVAMVKVKV